MGRSVECALKASGVGKVRTRRVRKGHGCPNCGIMDLTGLRKARRYENRVGVSTEVTLATRTMGGCRGEGERSVGMCPRMG